MTRSRRDGADDSATGDDEHAFRAQWAPRSGRAADDDYPTAMFSDGYADDLGASAVASARDVASVDDDPMREHPPAVHDDEPPLPVSEPDEPTSHEADEPEAEEDPDLDEDSRRGRHRPYPRAALVVERDPLTDTGSARPNRDSTNRH